MRKCMKRIGTCLLLSGLLWGIMIVRDKQTLKTKMIRLHVVAASDTAEDQSLKLQVRDAVIGSLQEDMVDLFDATQAKAYLQENLPKIEAVANQVLQGAGHADVAAVSLGQEAFPVRCYDTFTLPSGVYETLRITIGEGKGHNWWCVVFPALCVGATVADFEETAQCAGFPEALTDALSDQGNCQVRFFVLDAWGRLENFLYKG